MFQYSKNGAHLTQEQRQFYDDNGYLIITQLVDDDLLDNCRSRFVEVCNNGPTTIDMMIMKELSLRNKNVKGEYIVNKIQNLLRDDVFYSYASYKPLLDVIESIIGPNITCCTSMVINKPPDAEPDSSKHALHQDYFYFPMGSANSIVASWTAIDNSNPENGGLYAFPGSHKNGLINHNISENSKNVGYYQISNYQNQNIVYFNLNKGDTIFLHPLILHGSGPNRTKNFRKAISCFYIDSNCHFMDLEGTPQEDMQTTMFKAFSTKHKHIRSYLDEWKFRSRLIQGPPGNYQRYLSQL